MFFVGFVAFGCSSGCYVDFEAEYGTSTGTTMHRSEASNKMTVLLFESESIEHRFTTSSSCVFMLRGLHYSNDGLTDNVTLSINGQFIVQVETIQEYGDGHLWNEIRDSGSIGKEISIAPGQHSLEISVTSSDSYGVEIDVTILDFSCENDNDVNGRCLKTVVEALEEPDSNGKKDTLAIVVSVVTIIGTLVGLLVPAIIVYNCYRQHCNDY